MKNITTLLLIALTAPLALRAQTPTSATQTQPATAGKPDVPVDWVDDWRSRLSKALAANDQEAIKQLNKEFDDRLAKASSAPPAVTTSQQPAKPAAASPCVIVPPKKPGFLATVKKHVENTVKAQTAKVDAQVAKASKGNVDAGVQDTTAAAINQANQPTPCAPAKPGKQ